MTVDKDKAVLDWALECPLWTDTPIFGTLNAEPNSMAIIPVPDLSVDVPLIDGGRITTYGFAVQVTLTVSDARDDTNTDNLYIQRQWQDWIDEQEEKENYPDFGAKCSGYEVKAIKDTPSMALLYEDGTAKYQFFATITYTEEK